MRTFPIFFDEIVVMNFFELKTRRVGGDTLLVCDLSKNLLLIFVAQALIVLAIVVLFIIPDLELLIQLAIVVGLLIFEIAPIILIKFARPTLVLRGLQRKIELFGNTRCSGKSQEFPVGQISKFVVIPNIVQEKAVNFSFKAVLKDGNDFTVDDNRFRFIQESEINQTVQKLSGYSGAPAFDSKGNKLPPLSYSL